MPPSTPYGQLFFVIDNGLESGKNIYNGIFNRTKRMTSRFGFFLIGLFLIINSVLALTNGKFYYRGVWKEPTNYEISIYFIIAFICLYYSVSKKDK